MAIFNTNLELNALVKNNCTSQSLFHVFDTYKEETDISNTIKRWKFFLSLNHSSKIKKIISDVAIDFFDVKEDDDFLVKSSKLNDIFDSQNTMKTNSPQGFSRLILLFFLFSMYSHKEVIKNITNNLLKKYSDNNNDFDEEDYWCQFFNIFEKRIKFGKYFIHYKSGFDKVDFIKRFYNGQAFDPSLGNPVLRVAYQSANGKLNYLLSKGGARKLTDWFEITKSKNKEYFKNFTILNSDGNIVDIKTLFSHMIDYIEIEKALIFDSSASCDREKQILNLVKYVISVKTIEDIQSTMIEKFKNDITNLTKRIRIDVSGKETLLADSFKKIKFEANGLGSLSKFIFERKDILFLSYQYQYNFHALSGSDYFPIREYEIDKVINAFKSSRRRFNFCGMELQKGDNDADLSKVNISPRSVATILDVESSSLSIFHFHSNIDSPAIEKYYDKFFCLETKGDGFTSRATMSILKNDDYEYKFYRVNNIKTDMNDYKSITIRSDLEGMIFNIPENTDLYIGSRIKTDKDGKVKTKLDEKGNKVLDLKDYNDDELSTVIIFHDIKIFDEGTLKLEIDNKFNNNEFVISDQNLSSFFSSKIEDDILIDLVNLIRNSTPIPFFEIKISGKGIGKRVNSKIVESNNQRDNLLPDTDPKSFDNENLRTSELWLNYDATTNTIYINADGYVSPLRCTWVDYFTDNGKEQSLKSVFGGLSNQDLLTANPNPLVLKGLGGEPNFNQPLSSFRAMGLIEAVFNKIKLRSKALNNGNEDSFVNSLLDAELQKVNIPIFDYKGKLKGIVSYSDYELLKITPEN